MDPRPKAEDWEIRIKARRFGFGVEFETPSRPRFSRRFPRGFTLISRAAGAPASYPHCLSVYPLDSRSRVFYVTHPIRSIHGK